MTDTLWTLDHIAEYLVLSDTAADHAVGQPDFPKPIVLPSRGRGARQIVRYVPEEVKQWAFGRKVAA